MRNLTLFALLLLPGSLMAQATKVGVIDFQGATMASDAGLEASRQIEDMVAEIEANLSVTEAEIVAAQTRYQTQQRALSATALAQLENEITRLQTQFTREQEDAQLEVDALQTQLLSPITERVQAIVLEYAEREGYTMILDPTAVVYASEASNITDEIIELLNVQANEAADEAAQPTSEAPAQ